MRGGLQELMVEGYGFNTPERSGLYIPCVCVWFEQCTEQIVQTVRASLSLTSSA